MADEEITNQPIAPNTGQAAGAFVVVDAQRVAPGIELPPGYHALEAIGSVMILERTQGGAFTKSIIDGPIEDIYSLHHIANGIVQHDGTLQFKPEAVRVLNLIRIGANAERILQGQRVALIGQIAEEIEAMKPIEIQGRLAELRRQAERGQF